MNHLDFNCSFRILQFLFSVNIRLLGDNISMCFELLVSIF